MNRLRAATIADSSRKNGITVIVHKQNKQRPTKIMECSNENWGAKLADLGPLVQTKALEIARRLMEENKYSEVEAIEKAIIEAEEWYMDNQA